MLDHLNPMFGLTSSLVAIVCSLVLALYFNYRNKFNYWKSRGVKGPPPTFLLGNLSAFFSTKFLKFQQEWSQKYGKIYGMYFGANPVLVIADADVNRQICIQDFDIFPDHALDKMLNEYQRNFVIFMKGNHWKRVRALMTPTFTSGKIKRMYKLLEVCVSDLINSLETLKNRKQADGGNIINLKDVFGLYTLDGITACCYGLKLDRLDSTDLKSAAKHSHLVAAATRIFEFRKLRLLLAFAFPSAMLNRFGFSIMADEDCTPLAKIAEKLVEKRRSPEVGKKFDDYLQILIDADLGQELELDELDDKENHHAGLTQQSLKDDQQKMVDETLLANGQLNGTGKLSHKLTDLEMVSGAMFLLAVGLETTATLLTHTCYILAYHQEIQDRLHDEVKLIVDQSSGNFDYSVLTSCHYLDAVISETLRLLPSVQRTDRRALKDYYLEKYDLHIEKGTEINIFIYTLHTDSDYWTKPQKFNPDRFMPGEREKIVPGSYCPFGIGPRHCVGMRFSLTEAKLALATIMLKYRFKPAPGTIWPPKEMKNVGILSLANPIVEIHSRD